MGRTLAGLGGALSPYVDLSYSEAKLAAYTETGGGFPASFAARKDQATELRLGTEAGLPLAGQTRLFGLLEGAHRFQKDGPRTAGEIVGLFGFDLDGVRNQRTWLRAGVGVEGALPVGKGVLSVNATSKGEDPSVWLSVSWQMAF